MIRMHNVPRPSACVKIRDISKYSNLQIKTDLGSAFVSFYHPAAPCWAVSGGGVWGRYASPRGQDGL